MSPEKEQILYDKYPDLFSNKDKDIMSSCMAWGCEVDDGWYDILSSLCFMIKQHEDNKSRQRKYLEEYEPERLKEFPEYFPVKFDQIKEKYGGLRIYFSGGDDYIKGLVSMSETFSYHICKVCGQRGQPNKIGWISTLCDKCKNNHFNNKE